MSVFPCLCLVYIQGIFMHRVIANKHRIMLEKFFVKVLRTLWGVNKKRDLIVRLSPFMYQAFGLIFIFSLFAAGLSIGLAMYHGLPLLETIVRGLFVIFMLFICVLLLERFCFDFNELKRDLDEETRNL